MNILLCCIIMLNVVNFSYSHNISFTDFQVIAVPELYAHQLLQKYIGKNKNANLTLCQQQVRYYLKELLNKKAWAYKMFDAGTKIPSGLLNGLTADYGSFDECLSVTNNINQVPIYGQYCLGTIPIDLEKFTIDTKNIATPELRLPNADGVRGFMFATCLPNTCSPKEIQDMYTTLEFIDIKFSDKFCQSQPTQPKFTNGDIAFVSFFGVVLILMTLSTIYDIFLHYYSDGKTKPTLLLALSVLTNGKKLIQISTSKNQISCLHGIRVLSMMWVILGHHYLMYLSYPAQNLFDLLKWLNTESSMYILGAPVSVDTFLLLSGVLVSLVFMSAMDKGVKFNILIFYVHRYIRLTPVFAVLMVLNITVLVHLGSGPFWKSTIETMANPCRTNWWVNLLYIQNYVKDNGICIPHSWYLAVDTQLYLLSPAILFPLRKWPSIGKIIISGLGIASAIVSFIIAYTNKLRGLVIVNDNPAYQTQYYLPTHTRATPWLIGILLGYYIYNLKKNKQTIKINKLLVLIIWSITLGILAACVFAGHNTMNEPYDRIGNAFFISLLRPGWALGISVVIILCECGYGGPINWFLSVPLFQILSRLTYAMYLIHMSLQMVIVSQSRNAFHIDDLTLMHGYWGDYIFTVLASVIFTLAFESPIINLEKIIFGETKNNKKHSIESGIKKESD